MPQHVVYRNLPAETAILNLDTGAYHGLSPMAGRALKLLEETGSLREAAARLASETNQSIEFAERGCLRLCLELADRGLIVIGDGAA